jgi:hypothetical protein
VEVGKDVKKLSEETKRLKKNGKRLKKARGVVKGTERGGPGFVKKFRSWVGNGLRYRKVKSEFKKRVKASKTLRNTEQKGDKSWLMRKLGGWIGSGSRYIKAENELERVRNSGTLEELEQTNEHLDATLGDNSIPL